MVQPIEMEAPQKFPVGSLGIGIDEPPASRDDLKTPETVLRRADLAAISPLTDSESAH
jgi:hypothetical protein